eukprot:UN00778
MCSRIDKILNFTIVYLTRFVLGFNSCPIQLFRSQKILKLLQNISIANDAAITSSEFVLTEPLCIGFSVFFGLLISLRMLSQTE